MIKESINSSKVYCKYPKINAWKYYEYVLIVAKCIVNEEGKILTSEEIEGINSSKVYCKCYFFIPSFYIFKVLIVAKCIVNIWECKTLNNKELVLIVAKCIVNVLKKQV